MNECTICSEQVSADAQLIQSCCCIEKKCICHQCYIMWQKKTAVQTPELCMYCRSPHKDMSTLVRALLPNQAAKGSYLYADRLLILLSILISLPAVVMLGVLEFPGKLLFLYTLITITASRISGIRFPVSSASDVLLFENHRLIAGQNLGTFDVRAEELDYFIRISWARFTIATVGVLCAYANFLPLHALSFFLAAIFIGTVQGLRDSMNPINPINLVITGALALMGLQNDYTELRVYLLRQYSVYADILKGSFFLDSILVAITITLCNDFASGYIVTWLVVILITLRSARGQNFWLLGLLILAITIAHEIVAHDVFSGAPIAFMTTFAIPTFFDLVSDLLLLQEAASASNETVSSVSLRRFINRFNFQ